MKTRKKLWAYTNLDNGMCFFSNFTCEKKNFFTCEETVYFLHTFVNKGCEEKNM